MSSSTVLPRLHIVALLSAVLALPMVTFRSAAAQTIPVASVFVSAVDKDDVPVTELSEDDVEIKIAGKTQEVLATRPAERPLRVSILVSDGGTGAFQRGILNFVQKLYGRAEFQFGQLLPPEKLGPYAREQNALMAEISKLGVRAGSRVGAQITEGILEAAKDIGVGGEGLRKVILVLRIGNEAPSTIDAKLVRSELQKSGAVLYVISTQGSNRQPSQSANSGSMDPTTRAMGQSVDAEATNAAMNISLILGDGSKESGGRHDEVTSVTLAKAVESIADELLGQFEVAYLLPENYKPTDKFSVTSKRRGLTIRAPSR